MALNGGRMTDERLRAWTPVSMKPSWQQEGRLRRERLRGQVPFNNPYSMRLPDQWRPDDVTRHMRSFASRHPSLSIDSITESLVSFRPPWSGEIQHRRASSVAEGIEDYLRQWGPHEFPRHQGPLWNLEFIEGADGVAVAAVFDHLICDGWSLKLFQDGWSESRSEPDDDEPSGDGIFDWLQWQRETYIDETSPASSFWRDMFPDISGNRAVALRECARPDAELSGTVRTRLFKIDLSREDVRHAGRRQRVTPFMIWLAAIAATIAESAEQEDINMMVTVPGRRIQNKAVFAWMADSLPVRFREGGLRNPATALEVIRKVWPQVLKHQSDPSDYVLEHACAHKKIVSPPPALVTLNYTEDLEDDEGALQTEFRDAPGYDSGIQIFVRSAGESYGLGARWDVARFTDDGVAEFMGLVCTKMNSIVGAG